MARAIGAGRVPRPLLRCGVHFCCRSLAAAIPEEEAHTKTFAGLSRQTYPYAASRVTTVAHGAFFRDLAMGQGSAGADKLLPTSTSTQETLPNIAQGV